MQYCLHYDEYIYIYVYVNFCYSEYNWRNNTVTEEGRLSQSDCTGYISVVEAWKVVTRQCISTPEAGSCSKAGECNKILGFHGGEDTSWVFLGCDIM